MEKQGNSFIDNIKFIGAMFVFLRTVRYLCGRGLYYLVKYIDRRRDDK